MQCSYYGCQKLVLNRFNQIIFVGFTSLFGLNNFANLTNRLISLQICIKILLLYRVLQKWRIFFGYKYEKDIYNDCGLN